VRLYWSLPGRTTIDLDLGLTSLSVGSLMRSETRKPATWLPTVEKNTPPVRPTSSNARRTPCGSLRGQEFACRPSPKSTQGVNFKPRHLRTLTTSSALHIIKSQSSVEPNGMRHIVGGQCDGAYALDHRETLRIRSVRAHWDWHQLSLRFKYRYSA